MKARLGVAVAVVLFVPALAGCLRAPVAPPAQPLEAPDFPEGVTFEGGELVDTTRTSRTWTWSSALSGPVAEPPFADVPQLAGPSVRSPLTLPGTTWFAITATLAFDADASVRLSVVDEYGYPYCASRVDVDGVVTCAAPEVAPLGWERPGAVVAQIMEAVDVDVPFDVELTVSTIPRAAREPATPAGLRDLVPFEAIADDGTPLRGHVYLPNGDGPFATVLELSPYFNGHPGDQSERQAIDLGDRQTIRWSSAGHLGHLLDSGFAIALVNLRGTGESGGCTTGMDLVRDGLDAYAVIEGLAAEPWSNGNVGMTGISWHGYSQYAAASAKPPSLKALAPASAVLDPWLLWTRYGSPLDGAGAPFYAGITLDNSGWVPDFGDNRPDHLTCPEIATQTAEWQRIFETGDETPFWEARRAHDALAGSDVPMLASNGFLVPGEGHVLQAEGLWPLLPEGSHLLLGNWFHQFPSERNAGRYVEMLIAWFDHHLRGGPALVPPGVSYQDAAGAWHESSAWPPPGATAELLLSGDALVADAASVEASSQQYQSENGNDPEPERCSSWAVYASPPLAESVTLAGNFALDVTVSSTEPDGNFVAFLWHAPDVAECSAPHEGTLVTRAVTDLRHRGHLRVGEPFPAGAEDAMSLTSYPFAAEIPAGHRLVLAIGGGAESEVRDKALLPLVTIATGEGKAGALRLPLVDGELRFA